MIRVEDFREHIANWRKDNSIYWNSNVDSYAFPYLKTTIKEIVFERYSVFVETFRVAKLVLRSL